jgi:hypothetical protein
VDRAAKVVFDTLAATEGTGVGEVWLVLFSAPALAAYQAEFARRTPR